MSMISDLVQTPAHVEVRAAATAATIAVVVATGASSVIPVVAGANITSWILLGLAVAGIAVRLRQRRLRPSGQSPLTMLTSVELGVLLMLAGGAGAMALNGTSAASGLLRMIQHATILVAVASLSATWRSIRIVVAGLLVGVGVHVSVALLELLIGRTFLYSLWKPLEAATWNGFLRIASTPADPNYLALGLVSTLPLILVARKIWPGLRQYIVIAMAAAWMLTIVFTFSRAGYLALALMPLITVSITRNWHRVGRSLDPTIRRAWRRPGRTILALLALVAVLAILIMPGGPIAALVTRLGSLASMGGDASISVRVAAQVAALTIFAENPVFGIGYDRFVEVGPAYFNAISGQAWEEINVLNSYLLVASEGGVVALIGFLFSTAAALLALVRRAEELIAGDKASRAQAIALQALAVGLVTWSVISLTLDAIHSPIQWALLGLGGLVARASGRATVGS